MDTEKGTAVFIKLYGLDAKSVSTREILSKRLAREKDIQLFYGGKLDELFGCEPFNLAADHGLEERLAKKGLGPIDHEEIQRLVLEAGVNDPTIDDSEKIGWAWHLEKHAGGEWKILGAHTPRGGAKEEGHSSRQEVA